MDYLIYKEDGDSWPLIETRSFNADAEAVSYVKSLDGVHCIETESFPCGKRVVSVTE